mgnify:CR=1 FL=1
MGYGDQRKKKSVSGKKLITFFLMLSLMWIFLASIADRSPVKTIGSIGDLFKSDPDPLSRMNKEQLIGLIGQQYKSIDSLDAVIKSYSVIKENEQAIIDIESDKLNVRKGPSLSQPVLFKIMDSTVVDILYFDDQTYVLEGKSGSWCKIGYSDQQGWVWGNYLRKLVR